MASFTPNYRQGLASPTETITGQLPFPSHPEPFIYKKPVTMQSAASHKGVTILLNNQYSSRYPGNGRLVVNKYGDIVDKPKEIAVKKEPAFVQGNLFEAQKKAASYPYDAAAEVNAKPEPNIHKKREYIVNKRRVTNIFFHIVAAQRFKRGMPRLYLFTISFPPCVTDSMGYKFFNTWLTRCRKLTGGISYVWVAERQPDTGTIHFHLGIPHYLNVRIVNRYMKVILTTQVKKGNLNWNRTAANKYNGVDINKEREGKRRIINYALGSNSRRLSSYLSKYVTKNNEAFSNLAWNCSTDLSALKAEVRFTDSEWIKKSIWDDMCEPNREKWKAVGDPEKGIFAVWIPWRDGPPDDLINHLAFINYEILTRLQSPAVCLN